MLSVVISLAALAALLGSCSAATPSASCKNELVYSEGLRDYLALSPESMDLRVLDWYSFCDTVPVEANVSDVATLLSLFRKQTPFLPLDECSCYTALSSRLEGEEYIPPSLFVDYPVLGVILLVLAYFLRIYHTRHNEPNSYDPPHITYVRQTGDDGDCGPELLR